jgi:hypothetical protein
MSDIKERLKREIEKSGYPLEIQLIYFLRNSNWVALPQDYYFDKELQLERQIDIMATPFFKTWKKRNASLSPFIFNWFLAIECKKTNRNWVFFPISELVISCSGQYVDFLEAKTGMSLMDEIIPYRFGHYSDFREAAYVFTVFPKGKDEIFEAKTQILKYISYQKNERILALKNSKGYNLEFWFPIIVVDGSIWQAKISQNKVDDIEKVDHVLLKTRYKSSYLGNPFSYTIDIVTKDQFPLLINRIKKDISETEETFIANKEMWIGHTERRLKQFSERK